TICVDKTGTITENKMTLANVFTLSSATLKDPQEALTPDEEYLVTIAMWASEPIPFDPMEIAIHQTYARIAKEDQRHAYTMIKEYPLEGKPPMMTHVFENEEGHRIIAAKGAAEGIMALCSLSEE